MEFFLDGSLICELPHNSTKTIRIPTGYRTLNVKCGGFRGDSVGFGASTGSTHCFDVVISGLGTLKLTTSNH